MEERALVVRRAIFGVRDAEDDGRPVGEEVGMKRGVDPR